MIFASFIQALRQILDWRFLKVIGLGVLLSLGLLAVITWAVLQIIALLVPDAVDLPFVGGFDGLAGLATWGGFTAMLWLSVFLMIPVASAFSGVFLDEVADAVEVTHYPGLPPARGQTLYEGLMSGINFLGLLIAVNTLALVFYAASGPLFPLLFWAVNGYLLGREYFALVALRRMDKAAAKSLRRAHWGKVWLAGALMAAPLSVPIVNLFIPVLGVATFAHLLQKLQQPRVI
jgi:uncharacterized protein involved in cysteine biosynthesis